MVFLKFVFLFFSLYAKEVFPQTFACAHPELCKMAQLIFFENNIQNHQLKNLVNIAGDPHEFEPSPLEIKNLLTEKILLGGPLELNPWSFKINYQRAKNKKLLSLDILFTQEDFSFYPKASPEHLSHFWLYPKIYCAFKKRMEEKFIESHFLKGKTSSEKCNDEREKIEIKIAHTLTQLPYPIIFTHEALLPLFLSLSGKKDYFVAIKGSGHHDEATPQSMKKIYDLFKYPKVIWVVENKINIPSHILSKKRPADITIQIDTDDTDLAGAPASYFALLNSLNMKLQGIKK